MRIAATDVSKINLEKVYQKCFLLVKNAHSAAEDDGGRLLSADCSEDFFNKSGMLTSAFKNTHFFLDLF